MADAATRRRRVGVLLFEGFEVLDVYGPIECFSKVPELDVITLALTAGPVVSAQRVRTVADVAAANCPPLDIFLGGAVPGGIGTRTLVDDPALIDVIRARAEATELVLSVCTGAALLARTGLLDGHRATTNKVSFRWVESQGPRVQWVPQARWVTDGKYRTSSGISAGTDMALDVVRELYGERTAVEVATRLEWNWQRDATVDPFAAAVGLV